MVCHDLYKNSTFEICCFLFFLSATIGARQNCSRCKPRRKGWEMSSVMIVFKWYWFSFDGS